MKYFLALLLFLLAVKPVSASFNSAYDDYSFNYSKYRVSYNDYQVAKSTYTTYKTLTAQAEAIRRMRLILQARDDVVASYYDLLQERLLITPGLSDSDKNTFFKMKESEKQWMSEHQKKIDAASSLEDLNAVSADFEGHYPQMDLETKQAIGMVLFTNEKALTDRWDTLANNISDKLKEINLAGENTTVGERAVIAARNKKELAMTKFSQAQKESSLFGTQQRLTEMNQYLRESLNYLREIIRNVTG